MMSETDMAEEACPGCDGVGSNPAFVNRGPNISRHTFENVICAVCRGFGRITAEHKDRIEAGRKMRDDRVARGQTLRDEARAMGITPSELSRLERGG